jgi:ABC-type phosphate transport system substrate-binding protein
MGPLYPNAEGKADLDAGEASILNAANVQFSEDDNVLVQGVEGSKYAIGYFGYAYYQKMLRHQSPFREWYCSYG